MPNPTAVLLAVLALVLVIVAYRGTQANFIAAALGHPPQPGGPGSGSSGYGSPPVSAHAPSVTHPGVPGALANPVCVNILGRKVCL